MTPFPELHTARLILREITHNDTPALYAIHSDPVLMRWFGSDPLPDVQAAHQLVDTFASWRTLPNPGTRWGIQQHGETNLIGSCGLFNWHRPWRKCSVGYELAMQHQGQGYMREAMQAILSWGFEQMSLNRIEAQIHPQNHPSIKLARTLGFVEEGCFREGAYWGSQFHDMLQWSLLRRDFLLTD
ncbi:GNAT family protein [Chitinivorax sp. B]|uniref:GNAT family N-acetyltransferase n=1 Tax=Chitinivorax sp. B TaxID=2502235 RepID=UPI0010F8D425|nr:GNAT family protein [Chitinivorax sp. B]